IPVSTPHVISSAIVGSGAAERINKIRWSVVGEMVTTWLVTIPVTGIFSCLIYFAVVEFLKIFAIL
ncbi:MAG TPA: inorganic phosphate transporter, partial [Anaerolineales bacterium]|nr:inorganic phosphate transporter [Anaerolineales bacterium]